MIGQTISHYKIIAELGAGGMGVVYKAEDTKLKRTVVLKFLPPKLSGDKDAKARFVHEARAASKLQHHNICTIHEIGETKDGQLFISMDYYEGETLKEKLVTGPLQINETVDIVIQIAQGLSKAHAAGMVHRDLKPGNIIVTSDGVVKILDFGLAKIPGMDNTKEIFSTEGTVTYMSPEQAGGADVDKRSDIFSLGVVMYELLAGQPPFMGDYEAAIIYSIMNVEPESLGSLRKEVPAEIEEIVFKAIEKDPATRFQLVDELIAQLEFFKNSTNREPNDGKTDKQPSVGVLPFTNMSADKEQDYFCDGMTEDIIINLSQITGMRVAARTSCFIYKGKSVDIREIGKHLNVDTVLEGGVQKAGNRLRITVRLINVQDGYQIWSKRFDRDLEDVFAIQDEISRNIVEALEVDLTEQEIRVLDKFPTKDVEAYDFYIRGRQNFHKLGVKPLERARNLFTSAIITDPEYTVAYCGLADCHSMLYMYFNSDQTNIENAITASKKALKLDPELAEPHASYGLAISLNGQYEQAINEFKKAIQISPKLYEAYYYFARIYWVRGDLKKAAELFIKASQVGREDYQALFLAANAYRGLNQQSDLEKTCRRGLEIAEKHLENEPDDARAWYLGAQAFFELGDREKALAWIERAIAIDPEDPMTLYNASCVYCQLGMLNEFFDCFEKAMESMSGRAYREWCTNDPYLDPIRSNSRYLTFMERFDRASLA